MYIVDLYRYWRMSPKTERITLLPIPRFVDKFNPVARHYYQQDCWLIRKLTKIVPSPFHVSFGGRIDGFVGQLAAAGVPVLYCDLHCPPIEHDNVFYMTCDITKIPAKDGQFRSVSCMHTLEHIGLGRYGDTLDPYGWVKALNELKRVVAPGGDLFVSVPIGRQRTAFNGGRFFNPCMFCLEIYTTDFNIMEMALITTDEKMIMWHLPLSPLHELVRYSKETNACLMFHMKKRGKND